MESFRQNYKSESKFYLTFLSVVLVFRTDEKYIKSETNIQNPKIMLIIGKAFNKVYELFIKSSYTLGLLLIVSLAYYFTVYGLNRIVNGIFIFALLELIALAIVRMCLSLLVFNTLIKVLIQEKVYK